VSERALEALARMLAQGIAEAAREAAREEGRRAALEVLDKASAGGLAREWVTQAEAARVAGVTPQTIREWLRGGKLGASGERGRVNLERLRKHLAGDGQERAAPSRARAIAGAVLAAGGARR
jgi:transcription initiation factor TFIIIB Brf1 subunit/transcription initiation factor TFIIB